MPQHYKISLDERMAPNRPRTVFYICIHLENTNPNAKWIIHPNRIRTANVGDKQDIQFYKSQKTIDNKTTRVYEFTAALHEAKSYESNGHAQIMLKNLNKVIPDGNFSIQSRTIAEIE